MLAAQIAPKLIYFIGNTRDKLSPARAAYFWTKKQCIFFAFSVYVLFGLCHGIQIDIKYFRSIGRTQKAIVCKYHLTSPRIKQ